MGDSRKSTYTKSCLQCGKDFILKNKAYERRGSGIYCSVSCSNRKWAVNENYFQCIDTPNKAYWLGFLFADGYHNGEEMTINLSLKDKEHLELFKKELSSEHPIKLRDKNTASFKLGSKKLCSDLDKHGCVQAKTLTIGAPQGVPDALLSHFLRGYFDGDGCIYHSRKKGKLTNTFVVSMHCASPIFRNWIINYLVEQNIPNVRNPNSQLGRNIVISSHSGVKALGELLYSDEKSHRLNRKFDKFTLAYSIFNRL